jgi:hypothetical protein
LAGPVHCRKLEAVLAVEEFMSRSLLAILFGAACASCAVDPIDPNIWSLALADPNSGSEVYLGGHYSLEACRRAGVDWFTENHPQSGVLQCQLNCRKVKKHDPVTCDATEPVG